MRCPDPEAGKTAAAGGFMPDTGTIVMCQQWAAEQPGEVPNTVAHEMIHAYDDARARLDWTNLVHHACTEIRAANLSGDCSFWREVNRANVSPLRVAKAGERCVRRRAQISVAMNPACTSERAAEAAVDQATTHHHRDTLPRRLRLQTSSWRSRR
ncbi:hypothetical protein EMIHUDRAFT_443999 [Emiliania huxleyi CCMP1516]|uniref:Mitochondrial inner membrane protease ATP23 n=2 Tax=Emiliania huxleyi TaxID=2903 RepID=A0A0D3JJN7_EMIH1|nr:mitochondrial inner membrane peptidase Atp23 [Emiliania huxleyi CCMP1516]XP_005776151.1 hypothetical protein EMIHUDRAFT_443999 [Emiliania huxleyi CCMP1516]EOD22780.1 mitochondrial inner membrane peptidase Atp23 [Emiliania huxleyi CCMP1516]EOD23722.1 hypothetical protein EMIHUDRAFT_443999 [Emiliania huxleyi CCMP1516]|eukprot:XP_005775209.1 mitochondrial inner membrane peptidase Atp23 [Emiliania huxleyi CCMP1516]